MIQRIIPVVIGITLLLSGCASQQDNQGAADFSTGATLLKVAHLPSPTADGSSLYITVDGQDAGLLPVGEAILLQVPAGEHQVGGYARSLIGSVTIPALKVTTSADSPRFVAYRVARYEPLFVERGIDPLPQSAPIPEKQVAESKPVPVPQITQLSLPESPPVIVSPDAPESSQGDNPIGTPPAAEGVSQEDPAAITEAPAAAKVPVVPSVVTPKAVVPAIPTQPTTTPAVTQKVETPKPAGSPKPTETPKPTESPKQGEEPKAADAAKPAETAAPSVSAPQDKAPVANAP